VIDSRFIGRFRVLEEKLTGRPEDAVAETVNGGGNSVF
jgi:hypothetical protein